MLTLEHVVEAITGERPAGLSQAITGAAIDSRQVIPGALFVALPGERVDGHDYVREAFENGAAFALVHRDLSQYYPQVDLRSGWSGESSTTLERGPACLLVADSLQAMQKIARYWRRQIKTRVVGITGSVGKSTTKEVVAEVLKTRYRTHKSPGNLNNEIGLPLTILQLEEDHERAVLEMGFYVSGEIGFLCDIALPQVGVVTNIGTVHAERAGTKEDIAQGKSELVQSLPPAPEGVAILNCDDPMVRSMASQTEASVFYYGLSPDSDLWADEVEGLGLEGIRFRMHYQSEILHVRIPLIGRHSVHTALRAAAVGLVDGLTWEEILGGMQSGQIQLRLVAVRGENGALILDDTYNASPESTLAALNLLDEMEGRKIAVLGDMLELGQYEQQGHEMVGVRAAEVVSELITVGKRARVIAVAAAQAGLPEKSIKICERNQEAIDYLRAKLDSSDIVLVKGSRGMQMEIIVSGLEARE
jgi:UDP-N-acetylmuramoyl-tripeptide--D-alanyl-D-alanine ligase